MRVSESVSPGETPGVYIGRLRLEATRGRTAPWFIKKKFSRMIPERYSMANELYSVLGDRYILYGELLYAKHTIFYNNLPHYFLEYDVLDLATATFLDTNSRHNLLQNIDIESVTVLYSGKPNKYSELTSLVKKSNYIKIGHIEVLKSLCTSRKIDQQRTIEETDNTNLMEGLYIKLEKNDIVKQRYKYIREEFITKILNSSGHWLDRPIIANQLSASILL